MQCLQCWHQAAAILGAELRRLCHPPVKHSVPNIAFRSSRCSATSHPLKRFSIWNLNPPHTFTDLQNAIRTASAALPHHCGQPLFARNVHRLPTALFANPKCVDMILVKSKGSPMSLTLLEYVGRYSSASRGAGGTFGTFASTRSKSAREPREASRRRYSAPSSIAASFSPAAAINCSTDVPSPSANSRSLPRRESGSSMVTLLMDANQQTAKKRRAQAPRWPKVLHFESDLYYGCGHERV